ncbi:hypothetical protein ACOMHN_034394 [Nucella lapillus]
MLVLMGCLLLSLAWTEHSGEASPMGEKPVEKRFNFFDAGPCITMCSAECGGICFFNTRTFAHVCNCAFKRSLG